MKEYSYQITKYGYKVFCDGVCILWAETEHKKGKRWNNVDKISFTRAAQSYINLCRAKDKYNLQNKELV